MSIKNWWLALIVPDKERGFNLFQRYYTVISIFSQGLFFIWKDF